MALIDRVSFAGETGVLAWKFPSDSLSTGTQVIVNQNQEAVLYKGGQALDVLKPGTHSLSTGNIPILANIVNLPYGGKTPFTAEVWYVDKAVHRDLNWGTKIPIPIRDTETKLPLSLRAFGKWGMRVEDSRSFLTQIVGTQRMWDTAQIHSYFIGEICQRLTTVLSSKMKTTSFMEIGSDLNEIAEATKSAIVAEFARFGLEIINFNVISVNIPDSEQAQLNDILSSGKKEAYRVQNIVSANNMSAYAQIRSLDALESAASNEGGAVGGIMGAGLGMGLGMGIGIPAGQQLGQQFQVPTQPNTAQPTQAADPIAKLDTFKKMLDAGLISQEDYEVRKQAILDTM
ncbi:MAG: SPFH domain-containing protein [Thermoguttaceae bacterium]